MSASAECAWVLWESTNLSPRGPTLTEFSTDPVRAYNTKQDCDRGLTEVLDAVGSAATGPSQKVEKDAVRHVVLVTIGGKVISYRYVCLPDTIDPRGPKGK